MKHDEINFIIIFCGLIVFFSILIVAFIEVNL